jgi:hypothetical protein
MCLSLGRETPYSRDNRLPGTACAKATLVTPIDRLAYAVSGLTILLLVAAVIVATISMLPVLVSLNGR